MTVPLHHLARLAWRHLPTGQEDDALGIEAIWQPRISSTHGVFRVRPQQPGDVRSVIVKVVDCSPRSMAELDLIASGVLRGLPEGLATAQCFGAFALREGGHAIVLEEILDLHAGRWPHSTYERLAYLMGVWGATAPTELISVAGRRPPRNLLENADAFTSVFRVVAAHRGHPLVDATISASACRRLRDLVSIRPWWRDLLAVLPDTVAHGDLQRRNAFALSGERIALIDWANCAMAYGGIDIATLTFYAVAYADIASTDFDELVNTTVSAYQRGLGAGGLGISADLVRTSVISHLLALSALELANVVRIATDDRYQARMVSLTGESTATMLHRRTVLTESILGLAE